MNSYDLRNLVKEPTCFKADNPRCVDLILTNRYRSFQHTTTTETGLSDFHKMIVTVLKTTYQKAGPTVINYREYKKFSEQTFKRELKEELASIKTTDLDYSSFQNCFEKVLDKHAPMKKKYARANDGPFMTRVLRKATMLRFRFKNRYNKSRTAEHWKAFRRQRNLCVKLFRTEKRNFYKNLNTSDITDNKKFWKTVKPVLSDKSRSNSNISLIDNNRMISNDKEVVEAMNDYFISITDSLGLTENRDVTICTNGLSDPIEKAIMKYSKHPSIRKIRSFAQINGYFKFEEVILEQMHSEIEGLNPKRQQPLEIYPREC